MNVGEVFVKLGLNKDNFRKSLADAKGEASEGGGLISRGLKQGLGMAAGFFTFNALANGLKNVIGAGIDFNSNIQQNTIAFTQMLGSASKARAMLGDLTQFAANTPFELNQVETGAKQLLAFGFSAQQVKPMLTSIGDAASGLGLGADGINRIVLAMGQMKAHGTADGNDLLQLMQAGVPVWDILSKKIGKSTQDVQKMVSKGLLPSGQAIQMLTDGMEQRFPHMMDAQSKSFAGLMSTLGDDTKMVLGQIMKPAFDWISGKALPAVTKATGAFSQGFTSGGLIGGINSLIGAFEGTSKAGARFASALNVVKSVVKGLSTVGTVVKGALGVVFSAITGTFGWMEQHGAFVKSILVGILSAFTAFKVVTGILKAITAAQALWNAVMMLNPFTVIALAIVAVIGTLATLIYFHFGAIEAFFHKVWGGIATFFTAVWDGIKEGAKAFAIGLLIVILGPIGLLIVEIVRHWEQIKQGLANAWNAIVTGAGSFAKNVWNAIVTGFDDIVTFFEGLPAKALQWGKNFIGGFVDGIKGAIGGVVNAAKGVMGNVKRFLGFNSPAKEGEGRNITKWGGNMIAGFMDGITGHMPALQALMSTVIKAPNLAAFTPALAFNSTAVAGASSSPMMGTDSNHFHIQQLIVREEADVKKIAQQLYQLQQKRDRAQGVW